MGLLSSKGRFFLQYPTTAHRASSKPVFLPIATNRKCLQENCLLNNFNEEFFRTVHLNERCRRLIRTFGDVTEDTQTVKMDQFAQTYDQVYGEREVRFACIFSSVSTAAIQHKRLKLIGGTRQATQSCGERSVDWNRTS